MFTYETDARLYSVVRDVKYAGLLDCMMIWKFLASWIRFHPNAEQFS